VIFSFSGVVISGVASLRAVIVVIFWPPLYYVILFISFFSFNKNPAKLLPPFKKRLLISYQMVIYASHQPPFLSSF